MSRDAEHTLSRDTDQICHIKLNSLCHVILIIRCHVFRTHMQDLKDVTDQIHYESFRRERLKMPDSPRKRNARKERERQASGKTSEIISVAPEKSGNKVTNGAVETAIKPAEKNSPVRNTTNNITTSQKGETKEAEQKKEENKPLATSNGTLPLVNGLKLSNGNLTNGVKPNGIISNPVIIQNGKSHRLTNGNVTGSSKLSNGESAHTNESSKLPNGESAHLNGTSKLSNGNIIHMNGNSKVSNGDSAHMNGDSKHHVTGDMPSLNGTTGNGLPNGRLFQNGHGKLIMNGKDIDFSKINALNESKI